MKNYFKSITFRVGFLVFCLLGFQAALVYVCIDRAHGLLESLNHVSKLELPATRDLSYADMNHDTIRSIVYQALYFENKGKKEELTKLNDELKSSKEEILKLITQTGELNLSEKSKEFIAKTLPSVKEYTESANTVLEILNSGNKEKLEQSLAKFDKEFSELEETLEALSSHVLNEAKQTNEKGKDIVSTTLMTAAVGIVFSLFVSVFMVIGIRVALRQQIVKVSASSLKTNELGKILNDEALKITQSSDEQAAAIQETVSALSEMTSMIAQTSSNVKHSLTSVESTKNKTFEGKQIMEHLAISMNAIQKANVQLQEISQVIEDINNKTGVINDIVFKTQLLSFNASIEAARAGQQGRGFAVVAEEVGSLAEMSGQASKEIEHLLGDSQRKVKETLASIHSRVEDGNRVCGQATSVFNEIDVRILEISEKIKSINEATQQQELGIQQTGQAMKEMDIAAQRNQESSAQAFRTAEELKVECDTFTSIIRELEILSNGLRKGSTSVNSQEKKEDPKPMTEASEADLMAIAREVSTLPDTQQNQSASSSREQITADSPHFTKKAV